MSSARREIQMLVAPFPSDEQERLAALESYDILDTPPERAFDDLTRLAARLCGTPVAMVSLVDAERQWFKAKVGTDACETPRDVAFCAHAILDPANTLVVTDARKDSRFADNPLVTGPALVVFYAGVPLVDRDGGVLGTLCVIDHEPRTPSEECLDSLRILGRQVVSQLELRRTCIRLGMAGRQLARTNESLREFTSMAAHDLSEPLRTLVTAGSSAQEHLADEDAKAAGEDVVGMVDEAQRLQRLVNDLLVLSRVEFAEVMAERVDLRDCVSAALQALAAPIRSSHADVIVDPLPVVRGNRTLLTQIFQNLVSNAVRFVEGRTPCVHVTCEHEGERLVLGVKDNGVGIPAELVQRAFAPLETLAAVPGATGTGSGVGLAIVQKAVAYHGGQLHVDSSEGEGTHVTFTLSSQCLQGVGRPETDDPVASAPG